MELIWYILFTYYCTVGVGEAKVVEEDIMLMVKKYFKTLQEDIISNFGLVSLSTVFQLWL